MSTFPIEPSATPAAPAHEPDPAQHIRQLSEEELTTLPLQALLVRSGHLTLDQLAEALRENVATGRAVEDIALSRGWISAVDLSALKVAQADVAPAPAAPAPIQVAPAPAPEVAADTSVGVFLNLEDGSRIWAGRFDSQEAAEQHAQQLVESLIRPEPGVWPRFGDQLVRPDAVVGVEMSPREEH